jgi:hypothetical protein
VWFVIENAAARSIVPAEERRRKCQGCRNPRGP